MQGLTAPEQETAVLADEDFLQLVQEAGGLGFEAPIAVLIALEFPTRSEINRLSELLDLQSDCMFQA